MIIDMTISIGLRRKRRISRSMMAIARPIAHLLIMNGLSAADGACSASRRELPV